MNWELLAWCIGVPAALGALWWWMEVGSARMHWRQASEEQAAAELWERAYRAPPRSPK